MSGQEVRVSVIVCAYTMARFDILRRAIDALYRQQLRPHEVIVVVDNNETLANRLEAVLPAGTTVLRNEGESGASAARNVGVAAASGELLAFIDDDAVADGDWLTHLTNRLADRSVTIVGGRIIAEWPAVGRPPWFPEELDWLVGCTYRGLPLREGNVLRNVISCNMALRREAFAAVGGFRPGWGRKGHIGGQGDDTEFCMRVQQRYPRCRIVYAPRAVVWHNVPNTRLRLAFLAERAYYEGFSKAQMKKLHRALGRDALATESTYLRHLLLYFLPDRLVHWYRPHALAQAAAVMLCIAIVAVGNTVARTVPDPLLAIPAPGISGIRRDAVVVKPTESERPAP